MKDLNEILFPLVVLFVALWVVNVFSTVALILSIVGVIIINHLMWLRKHENNKENS